MPTITELDLATLPLEAGSVSVVSVPRNDGSGLFDSRKFLIDDTGINIPLAYNLGSLTSSVPLTDLQETWNAGGVTFIGERRRITGTAYATASVAFSFEFDGNRTFSYKPRGDLRIGAYSDGSTDAGCVVSRNLFDGGTNNVHGFNHSDLIRRAGNMANASFDASPTYQANNYDHHAGLQDRPAFQFANAGQLVTNVYGAYLKVSVDTGTVSNRYGIYVEAPQLASGGAVTTQYGFYTEALTTGGTNYAYFSAGLTPSQFGGRVAIGSYGVGTTGAGCVVSRDLFDGLTDNSHGFVHQDRIRRSGGMASASFDAIPIYQANNYDHDASFQARPIFQLNGGQSVSNVYGLYAKVSMDTGTIGSRYGSYVEAPTLGGGGAVTTQYGHYVEALTTATTNWAFYSAGATRCFFGGRVSVSASVATPAGGSSSAVLLFGTTVGFGIYYGSGAPTVSAGQGSLYLRSDGSSTSTRLYSNTDGATGWTNMVSAT